MGVKLRTLWVLVAALVVSGFGAPRAEGQVRVGVNVGPSVTTVLTSYGGVKARGLWTYGAWARSPLFGPIGVQLEGRRSKRGYQGLEGRGALMDVVEISLLLSYDVSRRRSDAAFVTAGIIGVRERSCTFTTREEEFLGELMDFACDGSAPRDPVQSEPWEIAAVAGAGTEVLMGPLTLVIDARVAVGVTRLLTISGRRETSDGAREVLFAGRSVSLELLVGVGVP